MASIEPIFSRGCFLFHVSPCQVETYGHRVLMRGIRRQTQLCKATWRRKRLSSHLYRVNGDILMIEHTIEPIKTEEIILCSCSSTGGFVGNQCYEAILQRRHAELYLRHHADIERISALIVQNIFREMPQYITRNRLLLRHNLSAPLAYLQQHRTPPSSSAIVSRRVACSCSRDTAVKRSVTMRDILWLFP